MSHDAKSLQMIYSIEKKLEKNDFTFGYNVHGGGDYNKSQECFSRIHSRIYSFLYLEKHEKDHGHLHLNQMIEF